MRLTYGIAINDADYVTKKLQEVGMVNGKRVRKLLWECPISRCWKSMVRRVYNSKHVENFPTYGDKTVCEDWLRFSNFKKWMENQYYTNMQLDKDILVPGNTVYSPETCCFVPNNINSLLLMNGASRVPGIPIGVTYTLDRKGRPYPNPYVAKVGAGSGGKYIHLGYYSSSEEAHAAWQEGKADIIESVVKAWYDCPSYRPDVADALILRAWQLRLDKINGKETVRL